VVVNQCHVHLVLVYNFPFPYWPLFKTRSLCSTCWFRSTSLLSSSLRIPSCWSLRISW
jgi:hypothetical protein